MSAGFLSRTGLGLGLLLGREPVRPNPEGMTADARDMHAFKRTPQERARRKAEIMAERAAGVVIAPLALASLGLDHRVQRPLRPLLLARPPAGRGSPHGVARARIPFRRPQFVAPVDARPQACRERLRDRRLDGLHALLARRRPHLLLLDLSLSPAVRARRDAASAARRAALGEGPRARPPAADRDVRRLRGARIRIRLHAVRDDLAGRHSQPGPRLRHRDRAGLDCIPATGGDLLFQAPVVPLSVPHRTDVWHRRHDCPAQDRPSSGRVPARRKVSRRVSGAPRPGDDEARLRGRGEHADRARLHALRDVHRRLSDRER